MKPHAEKPASPKPPAGKSRARKTRPSQKVSTRRREVANLALKGWTQTAIARHLQIPQGTVSRDLAAMREFWREFPVYDFDRVRLEQLQKIDLVEAEAWAAWQRSQEQRRSACFTRGKTGETTRSSLQDQYGDPRYLREVARCVDQRYEMIGVPPPEAPPPPPPTPAEVRLSKKKLTLIFRDYLWWRDLFGDPPYDEWGGLTPEEIALAVAQHERDHYPTHRVKFRKDGSFVEDVENEEDDDQATPAGASAAPPEQNVEQPNDPQPGTPAQADLASSS